MIRKFPEDAPGFSVSLVIVIEHTKREQVFLGRESRFNDLAHLLIRFAAEQFARRFRRAGRAILPHLLLCAAVLECRVTLMDGGEIRVERLDVFLLFHPDFAKGDPGREMVIAVAVGAPFEIVRIHSENLREVFSGFFLPVHFLQRLRRPEYYEGIQVAVAKTLQTLLRLFQGLE